MKAQEIYHKMRAIAEDYHAYSDQLTAIAKWIEAEFDYNQQKLANGANTSDRKLIIPDVSKSLKCDCRHSGFCRYETVILETKELCRHKE